ncbi:MAG: DUF1501 domain-containing protein [Verrucomicrobia bacterium]|nr:DUF1501 domain-containing protein [Verrucomicrobiota bacterium]
MPPLNPALLPDLSRRRFLGSCCSAVGATGMLSALAQLRVLGALAQPGNGPRTARAEGDYKALVCLFLAGGNDANNVIIPADPAGYAAYATARTALALPANTALPLVTPTPDGRAWALHPSMNGVHQLFGSGKAALLANVGTLLYPTTKAQYAARTVPLPPQLFSHNDQQVEWQSSLADRAFQTGWGGRLADLMNAFNTNASISMSISLNGRNSFQVGRNVSQYSVATTGAIGLTGAASPTGTSVASVRTKAVNDLLTSPQGNLFETAFGGMTTSAIADSALLSTILSTGTTGANSAFPNTYGAFSTSNLAQQLRTIARLISARNTLGLKRQIFFARIGGWDLHDNQVDNANPAIGAHANLLADVSNSLKAFYDATVELGVADQVTTFTASDFGRTYNTNGDGSDHGWGSHHLIVGGAVKGGQIYGRMPDLTLRGSQDTGTRGQWIPTTSVDEYSATLATWFGVSPTDLSIVLPNLGRFARQNVAFL